MNVLSLFDGMSCGMIALVVGSHNVERYVAFENETKYATKTASHNFPDIEQRGDVFEADFTEFEGFDIVLAGFPCTKFSVAQKKDRETEPYSGEGWLLFEQAWRAVCEAKPKCFLFENNKSMAKTVQSEISKIVGFAPVCINSALVSAQNRQRLYWVGKRNEDGTYSKVDVPQPEDRGILLKDILEVGHDLTSKDKSFCLTASYDGACAWNTIERSQRSMVAEHVCAKTGLYTLEVPIYAEATEWDEYGKPLKAKSYADGKEYIVYEVKDGQITIKGKTYPIKLKDGFYIIRKLTVLECMRLQTVPEWYEFPVFDSQAYKMLGNGWTVDVIAHILKCLKREERWV